jgi:SAM-dependent methyltransferase
VKERFYDFLNRGLDRKGFGERRTRLVESLEGDVLEVGAGTGLNVPRYRRARRLVALEPDRMYGRRLRARAADADVPVEVVAAAAESLPFPDESFDHVVTSISLCSIGDLDRSLAEIRRVLRPGGTLHYLEHVRGDGKLGRRQDRFTPLQCRLADGCHLNRNPVAAIERAGLHVEEVERFAMPRGHPLIRDGVQGTAVKPGGTASRTP